MSMCCYLLSILCNILFYLHEVQIYLILDVMLNLLIISLSLDENLAPTVLQLLRAALSGLHTNELKESKKVDKIPSELSCSQENYCHSLVSSLLEVTNDNLLLNCLRKFLLQSNQTGIRWQAHSLILSLYK